ncbi:hypothetical protein IAU59_002136 [Kwoniella sp. CBS 9459]
MTDVRSLTSFLKRTYPIPEVDPIWVEGCVAALTEAGTAATVEQVNLQYLHADLAVSTLESRVFPTGDLHNTILFQRPTLLQIHSISEVGNSAFQIQTTMEQRSEVLSGQSRIRRMDDEEEEEVEDGKVPPYPRGMLKLEVGDGRRIMKAMEYKKIGDLTLGQTSLGCKLLVQNVRCLREILLLTPENTQVVDAESSVEHLEAMQKEQFLNDLKRRMGKLEGEAPIPQPARRRVPVAVRPPQPTGMIAAGPGPATLSTQVKRRAASPPSVADSSRPRRINPPAPPLFDPNPSPPPIIRPTPTKHPKVTASSVASRRRSSDSDSPERPPSRIRPPRKSTRAASNQASARVQQLYHDIPEQEEQDVYDVDDFDVDEFDYDIDESFIRQIDEVEASASRNGNKNGNGQHQQNGREQRTLPAAPEMDNDEYDLDHDDDDFMILDESMIRQLDGTSIDSRTHHGHTSSRKSRYFNEQPSTEIRPAGRKRYYDPDDDENQVESGHEKENDPGALSDYEIDESFIHHVDEAESGVRAKGVGRADKHGRSSGSVIPHKRSSQASSTLTLAEASTKRHHTSATSSLIAGSRSASGSRSSRSKQARGGYHEVIEISD